MTERERAINQDLHVLDEAHRLGRISRGEYRARRRRVLQALYDSNGVVTARKTLLPRATTTTQGMRAVHAGAAEVAGGSAHHALTTLLSMRPGLSRGLMLVIVLGVLLMIGLAAWLLLLH